MRIDLIYLVLLTQLICCCNPSKSKTTKAQLFHIRSAEIAGYPSGSTITFYKGNLYLMGDDARTLLVLNEMLDIQDAITLFPGSDVRVNKTEKADIESSEWIDNKLYLFGSGSMSSVRDSGFVFDPESQKSLRLELGPFYHRIRENGIEDLNLEGATLVKDHLVLANRRNLGNRDNYLIVNPLERLLQTISKVVKLNLPGYAGVSGLTYLPKHDLLILTASEEETSSTYDDGAIGESYLGLIENFSEKLSVDEIVPDQWVQLSKIHDDYSGQKIESVCTRKSVDGQTELLLVADNDNGTTKVFCMAMKL